MCLQKHFLKKLYFCNCYVLWCFYRLLLYFVILLLFFFNRWLFGTGCRYACHHTNKLLSGTTTPYVFGFEGIGPLICCTLQHLIPLSGNRRSMVYSCNDSIPLQLQLKLVFTFYIYCI